MSKDDSQDDLSEFENISSEKSNSGFLAEIFDFTGSGGRWWLLPIIIVMLLLGLLLILSATGAAPFIYTLF